MNLRKLDPLDPLYFFKGPHNEYHSLLNKILGALQINRGLNYIIVLDLMEHALTPEQIARINQDFQNIVNKNKKYLLDSNGFSRVHLNLILASPEGPVLTTLANQIISCEILQRNADIFSQVYETSHKENKTRIFFIIQ